jgi:hypothetical protein
MCTIMLTSIGGEADLQPYYGVAVVYVCMYSSRPFVCQGQGGRGWGRGRGTHRPI